MAKYNTRSPPLSEVAARHRPWLRNRCTICLGLDHQRSHCIYLITQRKLRYTAARYKEPETGRRQTAATSTPLPLRPMGLSRAIIPRVPFAIPRFPREESFQTVEVKFQTAQTTKTRAVPVALKPMNTVSQDSAELCPYDQTYHALKSEQSRLHERLCGGRCAKYGHPDRACGSVPCEVFEALHIRQLEREAARRSKADARVFGGARHSRALAWKPRTTKQDYDGYFDFDFKRHLSFSARTFRNGGPGQNQDECRSSKVPV